MSSRQRDDEDKPEMIFESPENYNSSRFNAAFDATNGTGPMDIVEKKDVPDAWNGATVFIGLHNNFHIRSDGSKSECMMTIRSL